MNAILASDASIAPTQWKSPVTAKAAAALSAATHTGAAQNDHVSVSPLAKALTGVAADMFALMDKDQRSTLEGIVSSGAMSAEDVANGLREIAAEALYQRYSKERKHDAEDLKLEEASRIAIDAENKELKASLKRGATICIALDEQNKELAPIRDQFEKDIKSLSEKLNSSIKETCKLWAASESAHHIDDFRISRYGIDGQSLGEASSTAENDTARASPQKMKEIDDAIKLSIRTEKEIIQQQADAFDKITSKYKESSIKVKSAQAIADREYLDVKNSYKGPSSFSLYFTQRSKIKKDFQEMMNNSFKGNWRTEFAYSDKEDHLSTKLYGLVMDMGGIKGGDSLEAISIKYAEAFDMHGIGRKGPTLKELIAENNRTEAAADASATTARTTAMAPSASAIPVAVATAPLAKLVSKGSPAAALTAKVASTPETAGLALLLESLKAFTAPYSPKLSIDT